MTFLSRRDFLKQLGYTAAVAAVVPPLGWKRRFFPGGLTKVGHLYVAKEFSLGFAVSREMVEDDTMYSEAIGNSRRWIVSGIDDYYREEA